METLKKFLSFYLLGRNLQNLKNEKTFYISGNETFQPQA